MTKEDSMFKNINLPGGVSTKATEYKDLARKGNRWESPVFGIGSAKESTDLPKPGQVSRKPHDTAQGRIRGGNHPNTGDDMSAVSGTTAASNQGYGGPQGLSNQGYGGQQGLGNQGFGGQQGFSNQVERAFDTNKDVTSQTADPNANKTYYDGVTQ